MHGAITPLFLAELAIPNARQCLAVAAPILAVMAAWWVITRTDQIIAKLFPQWEWERRLGWLNIKAERQADVVMRWIGYIVYALLAGALYGIVWSSSFFADISRTDNPNIVADGMWKLSTLLLCLGVWVLYLGWELIPKLRHQYEREELEKYRAELAELEEQYPVRTASRIEGTDLSLWQKSAPKSQMGRRR